MQTRAGSTGQAANFPFAKMAVRCQGHRLSRPKWPIAQVLGHRVEQHAGSGRQRPLRGGAIFHGGAIAHQFVREYFNSLAGENSQSGIHDKNGRLFERRKKVRAGGMRQQVMNADTLRRADLQVLVDGEVERRAVVGFGIRSLLPGKRLQAAVVPVERHDVDLADRLQPEGAQAIVDRHQRILPRVLRPIEPLFRDGDDSKLTRLFGNDGGAGVVSASFNSQHNHRRDSRNAKCPQRNRSRPGRVPHQQSGRQAHFSAVALIHEQHSFGRKTSRSPTSERFPRSRRGFQRTESYRRSEMEE
jgi:hypothetical protein